MIIILIFNYSFSQPLNKTDLSKIYVKAISDFLIRDTQRKHSKFDTLYLGNRKDDDPYNDFPDIDLPETIENTRIILLSPQKALLTQNEYKFRIYINMIGWADKNKAEFYFYVFSNGFEHQYNYYINYIFDQNKKEYKLSKVKFKKPTLLQK